MFVAIAGAYARVMRRVVQVCEEPADARELRLVVLEEIRAVVGFDAYAWPLTDPQTTVGCAPLADVPWLPELPRAIRLKYLTTTNRWTTLGAPVALLHAATGGDLSQSLLWRELLCDYDVSDVASVVFKDKLGCWGFLDLWRAGTGATFGNDEATFLADVAAPITTALRRCQANTFLVPAPGKLARPGPVVLLLSAGLEVLAQTPETEQYLRVLVPPSEHGTPIPASAYNVGAQLLAVEAGVDLHVPNARMHLADGMWVTVSAARIGDVGAIPDRDIAISIEATSPSDRLQIFGLAFGLSAREREVLGYLATGSDTRGLARRSFLSEHTVQDHLKSIFAKTSAHNRRTLLSRALGG